MRILVAGGTGLLGSELTDELTLQGHEVFVLTRRSPAEFKQVSFRIISWPFSGAEEESLALSCDAVINLAGESIAKRWSETQKSRIRTSRINFTSELLGKFKTSNKLKVVLSASAIGYYGDRKSEVLEEESPKGVGFLSDVCAEWEAAAKENSPQSARIVLLRTGVVLSRGSGALKELESLYKMGAGGRVGNGQQMMSWIHIKDWVSAIIHCLSQNEISGPVNLVAPEPVTNSSFTEVLGNMIKPLLQMPAPAFAVKLALGEQSSIALDSQNVRPIKLEKTLFKFNYPYLREALWDLFEYERMNRKVYEFYSTKQWIPAPVNDVFSFFANEKNLERLTPSTLSFYVQKKSTQEIIKGTLIDYRLKIHGVAMNWRSLISDWSPPHKFVDEQVEGPYTFWNHTHTFTTMGKGVLMKDSVHYKVPLGGIGRVLTGRFVRDDLEKIFNYRKNSISKIFGH